MSLTPYDYQIAIAHESGASMTLRVFSFSEIGIEFEHRYRRLENHRVVCLNELSLRARYQHGVLHSEYSDSDESAVSLNMHVIFPEKLGQEYIWGVDISPGAKTFFQFLYETTEPLEPRPNPVPDLRLFRVRIGVRKVLDIPKEGTLPMKPIEFPFPVPDRVTPTAGYYSFPFLKEEPGIIAEMDLPTSLLWHDWRGTTP